MVEPCSVHQGGTEVSLFPRVGHRSLPKFSQQICHNKGQTQVLVLVDQAGITECAFDVVPADRTVADGFGADGALTGIASAENDRKSGSCVHSGLDLQGKGVVPERR